MDKLTSDIFERAYQSYLTGGDTYSIKIASSNPAVLEKYNKSIYYLENLNLITVVYKSDTKIKILLTDDGINFGNAQI